MWVVGDELKQLSSQDCICMACPHNESFKINIEIQFPVRNQIKPAEESERSGFGALTVRPGVEIVKG